MKKILLATTAAIALAALGGCVGYPGGYSSGAWAGYDGGFDDGFHGYERPITWDDAYRMPVSYAPQYYYPQQPAYGPQMSGWYSTYYCPPQMTVGGY
jgi:hypothetical protein